MSFVSFSIENILIHQIRNFWPEFDNKTILSFIPETIDILYKNFEHVVNKRFLKNNELIFSPYNTVQWSIFLYRLSHIIYKNMGNNQSSDQIYYLNKIMHSNDWFYGIDLPLHFCCEHPVGSVLGRAIYDDYFFVYQGTTVGGNIKNGKIFYPSIGKNVILFANSSVIGKSSIGRNVILSAGCQVINEDVPDNCIVFGKSPNLFIKSRAQNEVIEFTKHFWKSNIVIH